MFKGFNLSLTKEWFEESFEGLKQIGKEHLDEQSANYESKLKKYVTDGKIDGTKIQQAWFPEIDADIFISHSGTDKELACALAGWMNNNFGLKCFVDSNVWGNSERLLKEMNSMLSNERKDGNGGLLYDYGSCNKVSQHVNAMLSIAIQKMIDKAEVTILLNTEHSIPVHSGEEMQETYSPWIYTEIVCTQIIRQKPLIVYRDYLELYHSYERQKVLVENAQDLAKSIISYETSLEHLIKLNMDDLKKWKADYDKPDNMEKNYPLDTLYRSKCPEGLKDAHNNYSKEKIEAIRNLYA